MNIIKIQKFVEIQNKLRLKILEILRVGKMEHLQQPVNYIDIHQDFIIIKEM